jgi:hypothetical protein
MMTESVRVIRASGMLNTAPTISKGNIHIQQKVRTTKQRI